MMRLPGKLYSWREDAERSAETGSCMGILGKYRRFVWTGDGEVEAQSYRKVSQIVIPCVGYGLGVCKSPVLFFFLKRDVKRCLFTLHRGDTSRLKRKWFQFKCSPVNQYLIGITLRDMEKSDTAKALKVSQGNFQAIIKAVQNPLTVNCYLSCHLRKGKALGRFW